MNPQRITHVHHQLRRPRPFVDLAGFFLFFGISGVDQGREARLQRRFEQETFPHRVTARLSPSPGQGRYRLEGMPEEVARRPWVVNHPGQAVTTLSDDGWAAFQAWQRGGAREVRAVPIAES
ncbi:hypothetical protein E7T09_00410 [Deinococcus sp. KSM4-11]|uniref:hypothetical protein n=1 Tax=Deinococcus sp. KSM4-11 TaxID=2568654 RepID=UPI0010A549D9|nr:hypothetical protein [Deinococcus sp. KSM4-11]THF87744.1 hypothetical protein E7T09_00410 [Deinococcus sp. KSM4-11]